MKNWLKLNIQKTKTMESGPTTSWQRDGETMDTVTDLFSLVPKSLLMVTTAMKLRHLLLGRKTMTNLESIIIIIIIIIIINSRDNTLPTKVHTVKVIDFPVVMYGCESWTTERAEHQRTNTFILWC